MLSSLTQRIVGAVVSVQFTCAIACFCAALWHERNSRLHAFDATLQGRSDSLLGAVQDAEDPADSVVVDPAELKLPKGDFWAVYNRGGGLLGGSSRETAALTNRQGDGVRTAVLNGHSYRILQKQAMRIIDRDENGGAGFKRPVTIVYAAPTGHVWHEVFEAAGFYAVVSFILVGATALLLVALVRAFLAPVTKLAEAAGSVSAASLTFTPPASALGVRELRPLAEAMSEAVMRLGDAINKQHRFVGDAAHELKTAVAVVRSSVQVLAMRPRSPEQYRGGLQLVLTDNERVEALVSRMLVLASFEEQPAASVGRIDVAVETARALDLLSTFAAAHGVVVERVLLHGLYTSMSQEALQTLVSNLLVNAIQHSASNAAVTVIVRARDNPSTAAVLEVQDAGDGIAPASLPFVFDRFYRADSSRSRETGGAGLGLPICKSIAEAAGASIELESMQGVGTRVRVLFMSA